MLDHLDDALKRYEFARDNLAAVDQQVQAFNLKHHVLGAITLDPTQLQELADLLGEQLTASDKFTQTITALAESVADAANQ